jgi:hypothetical protein
MKSRLDEQAEGEVDVLIEGVVEAMKVKDREKLSLQCRGL